jgi:predicted dehydrogenase
MAMLKGAVVGCGRMGAEPSTRLIGKIPAGWLPISHAEAIQASQVVELSAFSEVNPTRLAWIGQHYGITSLFTDCRHLLAKISPDLLCIATRTPEKAALIKDAIQAKVKGLYVEKPLANSLKDVSSILRDAAANGTRISYGVNRRFHSLYRQARDIIRSGELGEVIEVLIEFGEAPLFWSHPHSVDLMLFLTGQKPEAVQADLVSSSINATSETIVDSDPLIAHAQFWFNGGAHGIITRGNGCNVKVNCSRGSIEIVADGASLQIRKPSTMAAYFTRQESIAPLEELGATVVAIKELANSIIKPEMPYGITSEEIRFGMEMLIGCVFSHLNGSQRYLLTQLPENLTITGRTGSLYA